MEDIGRNDPCLCGSGKKYKKCCLINQSTEGILDLKTAENSLLSKLVAFANSSKLSDHQKQAFGEHFPMVASAPKSFWSPDKEINFVGWFVFSYRLPEEMRVIELFAKKETPSLNSAEDALLSLWLPTSPGIYEVQEVEKGRGMLLENIITKERIFVHDVSSSNQVHQWSILLVHILPIGEEYHFAGYVMNFYPQDKAQLLSLAKKEYRKYKRQNTEAGWPEFFRDRVILFFHYAYDKQINPPKLTIINREGDKIEFWQAIYHCQDIEKVREIIVASPDFENEVITTDKKGKKIILHWLHQPQTGKAKSILKQIGPLLGQITLQGNKLLLETNSHQRLAKGKNILTGLCGNLLVHKVDTMKDSDALIRELWEQR